MNSLIIQEVNSITESQTEITFSSNLLNTINIRNILINSNHQNIDDPKVLTVKVSKNKLIITHEPLFPFYEYNFYFFSIDNFPFQSLNGKEKLIENGINNIYSVVGPIGNDNPIKNYLTSYFSNTIYDVNTPSTLNSKYIDALSIHLSKALYDIRQMKNEAYLSTTIVDELKTRGSGPYDRLNEESCYEVLRVSTTPTQQNATLNKFYKNFPSYPVTLQAVNDIEDFLLSSDNIEGFFNRKNFILNFKQQNIIKINSILLYQQDVNAVVNYNLDGYGYQLLDSKYDTVRASNYVLLLNNQVKLNNLFFNDIDFSKFIKIRVEFEYKELGILPNTENIKLISNNKSVREVLQPLYNVLDLKYKNIVDKNGNEVITGGLEITNSNFYDTSHKAFLYEIPFRLDNLPNAPGQYSVDYKEGKIYVYGETSLNDGTGAFPPIVTYYYINTFKEDIDYVKDEYDIVALPYGSLLNNSVTISMVYEKVLVPNKDYISNIHKEVIEENIGNNLLTLNSIRVKNTPITNVFKIYNETTGELYSLNRWYDNKVYFNYTNPPRINTVEREKAIFKKIDNEILYVNSTNIHSGNFVYEFLLNENNISSFTEDSLGSCINTSLSFSKTNLFVNEKYFKQDFSNLINIGDYSVDYDNGIVYLYNLALSNNDFGSISYKIQTINTYNKNIINVNAINVYTNLLSNIVEDYKYISFDNDSIVFKNKFLSLENSSFTEQPYYLYNSKIGYFDSNSFINEVRYPVRNIRGIFETNDLINNDNPFYFDGTFNNKSIQIKSINENYILNVNYDGQYFIELNRDYSYLSPNISLSIIVKRVSDDQVMFSSTSATNKKVILSTNSPTINDLVVVDIIVSVNNLSNVFIDYDKGELYVDYEYLFDTILVDYEYGENCLDFSKSKIDTNSNYYVTYKVGALREALVRNFGSLVRIDNLTENSSQLERERYRDALEAAITSFILGPTKEAIENICEKISHVKPEIIESAFEGWSLGTSNLYPQPLKIKNEIPLKIGRYNLGAELNEHVSLPFSSTISLPQGSFETWITPQWNGIDNNAEINISIKKDGYVFDKSYIYLGLNQINPESSNFYFNKDSFIYGKPNLQKDGVFIYYDENINGINKFFINVIDGYTSNYGNYDITIQSNGEIANIVKDGYSYSSTTTKKSSIKIKLTPSSPFNYKLNFISDINHYILDTEPDNGRLSLYKDINGYLNFKIIDEKNKVYALNHYIGDWKKNSPHYIAATWKINDKSFQDELHLFVDGFEVPNSNKFGNNLLSIANSSYHISNTNTVGSNDLTITSGSNIVTSSINFSAYGISIGDVIEILDNNSIYIITNVSGQNLTLNNIFSNNLTNVKFTINKQIISYPIDYKNYKKISVSKNSLIVLGNDAIGNDNSFMTSANLALVNKEDIVLIENKIYKITNIVGNVISVFPNLINSISSVDFYIYKNISEELPGIKTDNPYYAIVNNQLVIYNGFSENDLISVETYGLNFTKNTQSLYQWTDTSNVLKSKINYPISLEDVKITRQLESSLIMNISNSVSLGAGIYEFNSSNEYYTSDSNGRLISITLNSSNIDYTIPVEVEISGLLDGYSVNEVIFINKNGTHYLNTKFYIIDSVIIRTKPINSSKTFLSLEINETNPITISDSIINNTPSIDYYYDVMTDGYLYGVGNTVKNSLGFNPSFINGILEIKSPNNVDGIYKISNILDANTLSITDLDGYAVNLSSFTNGNYVISQKKSEKAGLKNGYFYFTLNKINPYQLRSGTYKITYKSYLDIKLSNKKNLYIGADYLNNNAANCIFDETRTYSIMLDDIRINEKLTDNIYTTTQNFNSFKPIKNNQFVTCFIDWENLLVDKSYKKNIDVLYSNSVVNNNFGPSEILYNKSIKLDNIGLFDTSKQGSIELWINPLFDLLNDPNKRYYFDASSIVEEEIMSTSRTSVYLPNNVGKILSVKYNNEDYYIDGKIQYDLDNSDVIITNNLAIDYIDLNINVSQIISINIIDPQINIELNQFNYALDSNLNNEGNKIYLTHTLPSNNLQLKIIYRPLEIKTKNKEYIVLNKKLPFNNVLVKVNYIPKNSLQNRMSIYKDVDGYINFDINSEENTFNVKGLVDWSKNTWHKIMATYNINNTNSEMRLFLDGYQFVQNQNYQYMLDGYTVKNNIVFKDTINYFTIGADYNNNFYANILINGFKLSNFDHSNYSILNQKIDKTFSIYKDKNIPFVKDLYTTYIRNINNDIVKINEYSYLKNRLKEGYEFMVNIFDSFGIVNSSLKVKDVLETLIKILKPANSKVYISYKR